MKKIFTHKNRGSVLTRILGAQSPSASSQPNMPVPPAPPPVLLDDLIVEILSWLPVKSLLQFRCVCKSWKLLISDPNFVKLHIQRSSRNPNLLLLLEKFGESDLSVISCSVRSLMKNPPFTIAEDDCYLLNDNASFSVVGSCNGLFCLRGCTFGNTYQESWFCLWNPATRSISEKLAPLRVSDDIQSCYYSFAFGYDNLGDIYKVVAFHWIIETAEDLRKTQVKICSLGDNCWRNIQSFPVLPVVMPHPGDNGGVYLNGTLNWLALCNNSDDSYIWNNTIIIVSLDLGKETYTQLSLPHPFDEVPCVKPTLGVLRDCLCVCLNYMRSHFVVWQMKEFQVEKSWTQLVKLSYEHLQTAGLKYGFPLLPLCMSENGDVLIMSRAGEAIMCSQRDNRVERIELPKNICLIHARDYVESLVCLVAIKLCSKRLLI